MQERHNFIANASELRISCTNLSICKQTISGCVKMQLMLYFVQIYLHIFILSVGFVFQISLHSSTNLTPMYLNIIKTWFTLSQTCKAMAKVEHIDGLVQNCSISSVLAMEILQSCTKPSISSLTWNLQNTPNDSPLRVRYGMSHNEYYGSKCMIKGHKFISVCNYNIVYLQNGNLNHHAKIIMRLHVNLP